MKGRRAHPRKAKFDNKQTGKMPLGTDASKAKQKLAGKAGTNADANWRGTPKGASFSV